MTTNTIASSIFTGAPTDNVVVKDIYALTGTSLSSSLSDLTTFDSSVLESLRQDPKLAADFSALIKTVEKTVLSVDTKTMVKRILNLIKSSKSIYNGLDTSIQSALVNSESVSVDKYNQLNVQFGTTDVNVQTEDVNETIDVLSITSSYLGDSSLIKTKDIGAESALLTTLFKYAINLNIDGLLNELASKVNNPISLNEALKNNIDTSIKKNDLSSLQTIINIIGSGSVLSVVPNAVKQILQNYVIKKDQKNINNYQTLYNQLTSILNSLNPNWDKYNRNGILVTNLESLSNISSDAKTILSTNNNYKTILMFCSSFLTADKIITAKAMYPYNVIS